MDNYKAADWCWLISKFENRINQWCNRWLSLGGRFVLIKVVLESQPVYWMALENILASVLNRIRQLIFSFLWSDMRGKKHYHLCRWESITKTKRFGGWGLRNLQLFNSIFVGKHFMESFTEIWHLWHRVIKDKYLPYSSVSTWLRSTTVHTSRASQT
jgi:hypothetical protein